MVPIQGSKFDRFSILKNLPTAVNFAKMKMNVGKKLLVCCQDGKFVFFSNMIVCFVYLIMLVL